MTVTVERWWIAALLVGLATGCAADSGLISQQSRQDQQDAIVACTDLVLDYAVYRDQGNVDGYAGLFTLDGSLTVQGKTTTGREALRARIRQARSGPRTRHLVSTIRITPIDENRASGVSYATIYSARRPGIGADSATEAGPLMVKRFAAIGDYVDEFVRTDDGWRIHKRTLNVQFLFEDN